MKYRKSQRYKPDTSDFHPQHVFGDRSPSEIELMSHFALFRGVPMSARGISLRVNCRPSNVLTVLQRLHADGRIRQERPNGPPDETTTWVMD